MTTQYDAIVIGTGQAGPTLSYRLASAGRKVALIERGKFGGSCVNYGCTPTKTLVASARAAYMARRGAFYGVHTGDITIDMKRVKARKEDVVSDSRNGLEGWLESIENLDIYRGHGQFESSNSVRVNDELLTADQIFINVGTSPRIPDNMPGVDVVPFMTNQEILELDYIPEHLLIVGGSYIGLEFGQAFRRFGSEVTIVEVADRLVTREDPDISESIKGVLEAEGINLRLQAECISLTNDGERIKMDLECDSGDRLVTGSHVLLAVGRVPNTDELGVEKAGLEIDDRGYIQVNDKLETNVPGIWALGDVNGRGAFTHTSYNDHEIVAANLLDNGNRRVSDRFMTYGLFIDPPLGRVGLTEQQAEAQGYNIKVGTMQMSSISRAKEKGETQGLMKLIIDADTDKFLGAAILGVGGDEIVASITNTMYADAPYTVVRDAVHIHPTVNELIPTLLGQI